MTEQQTPTEALTPPPPTAPPMPEAPPVASPEAPPQFSTEPHPAQPEPTQPAPAKPKKNRRTLRAVLRWTAVVAVFAAVGTSAAYGITGLDRTDVPGLATESDGRWEYPEIIRPPLPSGSPAPFDEANTAGAHYADLRELVLPAPEGAKPDKALSGEDGWLSKEAFLEVYESKDDRETFGQLLTDNGLRHIAARGWTTEDGTRTGVYLLQFNTAAVVDEIQSTDLIGYDAPEYAVRGAADVDTDEAFPEEAELDDVWAYVYEETHPYGAEHVREAYLTAGDILALIVQARKGSAEAVPFQQTVVLQSQLLG